MSLQSSGNEAGVDVDKLKTVDSLVDQRAGEGKALVVGKGELGWKKKRAYVDEEPGFKMGWAVREQKRKKN